MTGDGGVSFERIEFPMSTVTELPAVAEEYGYTLEDYDYFHMPEERRRRADGNSHNRGRRS